MECRNSPVTKTPPRDLPSIPGVTSPAPEELTTEPVQKHPSNSPEEKPTGVGEWQVWVRLAPEKEMRGAAGLCPGFPQEGNDGDHCTPSLSLLCPRLRAWVEMSFPRCQPSPRVALCTPGRVSFSRPLSQMSLCSIVPKAQSLSNSPCPTCDYCQGVSRW